MSIREAQQVKNIYIFTEAFLDFWTPRLHSLQIQIDNFKYMPVIISQICEEYVSCNAVQIGDSKTFRRNTSPSSLGMKSEPSKKPVVAVTCFYSFLLTDSKFHPKHRTGHVLVHLLCDEQQRSGYKLIYCSATILHYKMKMGTVRPAEGSVKPSISDVTLLQHYSQNYEYESTAIQLALITHDCLHSRHCRAKLVIC